MPFQVRALFEFWAANEAELSFQVGDLINVTDTSDEGWWEGEKKGMRGLFPSNYVEPVVGNGMRMGMGMGMASVGVSSMGSMGGMNSMGNGYFQSGGGYMMNPMMMSQQQQMATPMMSTNVMAGGAYTDKAAIPRGGRPSGMVVAKNNGGATSDKVSVNTPSAATVTEETGSVVGLFASNCGIISAYTAVGVGFMGILWFTMLPSTILILINSNVDIFCSVYAILSGVASYIIECAWGNQQMAQGKPFRAIFYTVMHFPLWFSWASMTAALFYLSTGGLYFWSHYLGESYNYTDKKHGGSKIGWISQFCLFLISARQQSMVGTLIFLIAYLGANVGLFVAFFITWQSMGATNQTNANNGLLSPLFVSSVWTPPAKGFGGVLDFNCAIVLLPVCRTVIRTLYNRSTADRSLVAMILRGILFFIPLDQALTFHKLIARVIMIGTVGHTVSHFINLAFNPTAALNTFNGLWPILSGAIVCWTMLFLYAATPPNVKNGQFEIFWYAHHFFIFFFGSLLVHGKNGLNPHFYQYFVAPGALYLFERCFRVYRSKRKCVVLSVTLMDDVFSMEFSREGIFKDAYKEGQYVFLNAPPISPYEWHPFTISSAPHERSVTIHIRVLGPGSWTRGLCQYLSAMGPRGAPWFSLNRPGPTGNKLPGKIVGPDGLIISTADGPHSAPTQHLSEYNVAFVIGAGIGSTPVSAALKSVVFHRWRTFSGACFPDHAHFAWVCGHKDIDAFRWLIRVIKDAADEVTHMRLNSPKHMATKSFEFHIFLTSTPAHQQPVDVVIDNEIGFWGVPRDDPNIDKVRSNWDESDLYKIMKCPPPHTLLGDVHVWEGRPNWEPRFKELSSLHPNDSIGVMFCGPPVIAKDLKMWCYKSNAGRRKGLFKLHKENF